MQSLKKQAGSMLMSALFIAILMLALGLALVNILSSSAHNNAVEYYGARAFLAAQSGIEKSLVELFPLSGNSSCANVDQAIGLDFGSSDFLKNCTYTIACTSTGGIPDSSVPLGSVTVFRLTSSATCPINSCSAGDDCRKDFWQTQRSINVEAKTLN
ncbi:agglutinin biogenesis protein MshP [Pseudoalteromonas sp. C2R02]|uniref:agglutinin biogenesis protein MshP n=1 Tax=Pseudoalteromonas sp. C2R02 TaxID=2841565 RepID=UPI001C0A5A96|nr:agglutinin biogenesis protein MshP [Pseudoalteromonas sp. C2R02]MBU2969492.1 agglutinin biogenesis protein MshP [Pseudoalteromonas sp. C2R02]